MCKIEFDTGGGGAPDIMPILSHPWIVDITQCGLSSLPTHAKEKKKNIQGGGYWGEYNRVCLLP